MAKYLRDVRITTSGGYTRGKKLWDEQEKRARIIGYSTNSLEYLYSECLPRVETYGVSTVVIQACPTRPQIALQVLLRNPELLQLSKLFDFDAYAKADKATCKKIALKFLHEGLLKVAKIRGWKSEPFRIVRKKVLAENFAYYRPWTKTVTSPDRKHKAQVWSNFDSDTARIFVVFFHRREVIGRRLVTTVRPSGFEIRDVSGKLEWLSHNKVKLTSRDGKQSWKVSLLKKGS